MNDTSTKARQVFANVLLFPVAAAYAAVVLPWSVFGQFGWIPAPAGLQTMVGHAHEMLFGFALLVVAAYLLGPQPKKTTYLTLGIWAAARLSFLLWPGTLLAAVCNMAFVLLLAHRVVPRFTRTAKKWRNKAVAPIIVGLSFVVSVFHVLQTAALPNLLHGLLFEGLLILSTLMFFMGGRMIAPAVAGHFLKQNRDLDARVQPGVEGAVLILMGMATVLNLLPAQVLRAVTGVLLILCAILTLVRTARWQAWRCTDRLDLLALIIGYLWLAVGWLLVGLALLTQWLPLHTALHAITAGALGTLTLSVMARTRLHRVRKDPNSSRIVPVAVALISVAALSRIAAGMTDLSAMLHTISAAAWSTAFLVLLAVLLHLNAVEKSSAKPSRASHLATKTNR